MNIIIRAISNTGDPNIIKTTGEALACLSALHGHFMDTMKELHELGLIRSVATKEVCELEVMDA